MDNISRLALHTAGGGTKGKHSLVEEVALLRAAHVASTANSLVDTGGEEGAVNPVVVLKPAKTRCAVHPSTDGDKPEGLAAGGGTKRKEVGGEGGASSV
jgi:hypothetical protein